MFKSDNSQQLLIGKNISRTASVNVLDSSNASYLADGEVVVLDENDSVMAAGTTFSTSRYIKLVQRSGVAANPLIHSDRIDGANVIAFSGKSYSAPQEQIHSFGFNGVSGSIDASGTEDYVVRLTFKEDKTIWSHYSNTRIFRYEPDTTNTQEEVARYFAQVISDDSFSKSEVKVERLASVLSVAGGDAGITWTFTNGSKTVTKSGLGAVVAGDYVRAIVIGSDAITVPVYRVVSSTATEAVLDQAFQGTSGAVLAPAYFTAATAALATTNFGIKFTGKAQTFIVGKLKYVKVIFDFALQNFLLTTVTKTQEALRGNGTGEEVAEIEWYSYGFEGAIDKFTDSSPTIKADASVSSNYDLIAIEYFVNYDTQVVSGSKPARKLLLVAVVDGAPQETQILGALNPWMASVPASFANISL